MTTDAAIGERVLRFLRRQHPAASALRTLAGGDWRTYLFGGTLREIILRPRRKTFRDLDIVVDDEGFDRFKEKFSASIKGVNSFGGYRLEVGGFKVDAWPLTSTWAFRVGYVNHPSVENLQKTTFLNLDSIVMEITPGRIGRKRLHASKFIEAIQSNMMDLVLIDNPMPHLAAIRAIKIYLTYNVDLSRKLAEFVFKYLKSTSTKDCINLQIEHYGRVLVDQKSLESLQRDLKLFLGSNAVVFHGYQRQLKFFEGGDLAYRRAATHSSDWSFSFLKSRWRALFHDLFPRIK